MFPSREIIAQVRERYPVGTKVQLIKMDDPQAPPVGTVGIVSGVDDIGSIQVAWENGSTLSIVYGEDLCRRIGNDK